MPRQRKPLNPAWLLVILIPAMLAFAAYQFLNSEDVYSSYTKTYRITGWEAVSLVPHFWVLVWVGVILCFILLFLAYLNETGTWIGKNWKGDTGFTIILSILAILALILPWLRADKADGGATLPQQKSQLYERNPGISVDPYRNSIAYPADGVFPKG
jgi:hypothetical protein